MLQSPVDMGLNSGPAIHQLCDLDKLLNLSDSINKMQIIIPTHRLKIK